MPVSLNPSSPATSLFSEDLDAFLCVDGPAIAATLQGGATEAVRGFFDKAYVDPLGMAGTNPVFTCKATDVAEGDIGRTLTVAGVTYTIRNRQPQDDGAWVLLQLQG
jgi:hypothetical protein